MDGSGRLKALFEVQLLPALGPRAARHGCLPLTSSRVACNAGGCKEATMMTSARKLPLVDVWIDMRVLCIVV